MPDYSQPRKKPAIEPVTQERNASETLAKNGTGLASVAQEHLVSAPQTPTETPSVPPAVTHASTTDNIKKKVVNNMPDTEPKFCSSCGKELNEEGYCEDCDSKCEKCEAWLGDDGNCPNPDCDEDAEEVDTTTLSREELKAELFVLYDKGMTPLQARKQLEPMNIVDEEGKPFHSAVFSAFYGSWKTERANQPAPQTPPATPSPITTTTPTPQPQVVVQQPIAPQQTPAASLFAADPELSAMAKEIGRPKYAKVMAEYREARKAYQLASSPEEKQIVGEELQIHLAALRAAMETEFQSDKNSRSTQPQDKTNERYEKLIDKLFDNAIKPPVDPMAQLATTADYLDKIRGDTSKDPNLAVAEIIAKEFKGTREDLIGAIGGGKGYQDAAAVARNRQGKQQQQYAFYCGICGAGVQQNSKSCAGCGARFTGRVINAPQDILNNQRTVPMGHRPLPPPPQRPAPRAREAPEPDVNGQEFYPPVVQKSKTQAPPPELEQEVVHERPPPRASEIEVTEAPIPTPPLELPAITPYMNSVIKELKRLSNYIAVRINNPDNPEKWHDPVKKAEAGWGLFTEDEKKMVLFAAQLGYQRLIAIGKPFVMHPSIEGGNDVLTVCETEEGENFISTMFNKITSLAEESGLELTEAEEQDYLAKVEDAIEQGKVIETIMGGPEPERKPEPEEDKDKAPVNNDDGTEE